LQAINNFLGGNTVHNVIANICDKSDYRQVFDLFVSDCFKNTAIENRRIDCVEYPTAAEIAPSWTHGMHKTRWPWEYASFDTVFQSMKGTGKIARTKENKKYRVLCLILS
jgi:hypothetical protein